VTRVHLTPDSARRIGAAVRAVEGSGRDVPPVRFRQVADDGEPVRLGKTTAGWTKGAVASIELRDDGPPGSETGASPTNTLDNCVNKFANVEDDKWVIVAKAANGVWYLIAAEC
jgi:hypothetical protein